MSSFQFQNTPPVIWAMIDELAGHESQCLGVVESLGLRFQRQDMIYTPAAALPNFVMGATFNGLTSSSKINLAEPWPDIMVSAGRRTAPVVRNVKEKSGGATFAVQIMYPGDSGIDEFDLVAVPRHDDMPERENFIEITGAPHRVTPTVLSSAANQWADHLSPLPGPRIALIVGGSTKRRIFTDAMARELGHAANKLAADAGGSLMITTSRRTGDAAVALYDEITVPHHAFKWGDAGENPYFGYLGTADAVIVTGDSVSMCSEACATPGPVYIYAPRKLTTHKHGKLHKELYAKGYARPLETLLEGDGEAGTFDAWTHDRLNAADQVAAEIRKRTGL